MSEFTVLGLAVVREAARHGSFSVAADRLGYTQSAVSRQIALMEQAAGQPLFERRSRGVHPTEAGRLLLRRADAVLGELDAARQDLRELEAQPGGRLRVGAFSTALAALVPRAIATVSRRAPGLQVPLREGLSPSLLTAVARRRLDLAVVTPPGKTPDGVELVPLLEDPLFVAVPAGHPLTTRPSATPAALRAERWIAGSAEPGSSLLGAWTGSSWQPEIAFVAKDWTAKLGLVAAGLGVTVVPGLAVPSLPPTVEAVRIDHPAAIRPAAIARHSGGEPADAFVEALLDTAAELAVELRRSRRSASRAMPSPATVSPAPTR
ncbi:DNA-binding transcriptional LysR family regulator [Amycolatopsis magusensis]|uniref:DNA-binding transcriptional LysR family regulator n=1 Tax=Amycolatopsis magusensis TaxID=882444 RepID=A0ABS4PV48_9PSEU|nr:DNA-binding transcriptional LysR family regulator [Amycolatopsis magusensis]